MGLLYFRTPSFQSRAMSGRHVACGPRKPVTCLLLSMGKDPEPLPQYPEASSNTAQSVLKPGLGLVRSSLAL